jgi:hypothetical protein
MRFPAHYKSTDWIRKHNVLGLVQLIRFLVVKLIQLSSNTRFDICVVFMTNYFFSDKRSPRRQRDTFDD